MRLDSYTRTRLMQLNLLGFVTILGFLGYAQLLRRREREFAKELLRIQQKKREEEEALRQAEKDAEIRAAREKLLATETKIEETREKIDSLDETRRTGWLWIVLVILGLGGVAYGWWSLRQPEFLYAEEQSTAEDRSIPVSTGERATDNYRLTKVHREQVPRIEPVEMVYFATETPISQSLDRNIPVSMGERATDNYRLLQTPVRISPGYAYNEGLRPTGLETGRVERGQFSADTGFFRVANLSAEQARNVQRDRDRLYHLLEPQSAARNLWIRTPDRSIPSYKRTRTPPPPTSTSMRPVEIPMTAMDPIEIPAAEMDPGLKMGIILVVGVVLILGLAVYFSQYEPPMSDEERRENEEKRLVWDPNTMRYVRRRTEAGSRPMSTRMKLWIGIMVCFMMIWGWYAFPYLK